MTTTVAKIESGIVDVAKKIKAGIEDAGEDAVKLASFVQNNATEIEGLAALAGKKGTTVSTVALNLFTQVAAAVKAAGTAAGSNGLAVSFDAAVIADVKAVIADLESL